MLIGIKSLLLCSASAALLLASSERGQHFPKYKVDRKTMTVHAKRDPLEDVSLYKWTGSLPDTVTDTLRFFARNAERFMNENELNRMRCSDLLAPLAMARVSMGLEVTPADEERWTDSLKMIYPERRYSRLALLTDSVMRFAPVGTTTFSSVPLKALMEPGHWYLFELWGEGGSHMPYHCWWLSFYLDEQGNVQHWTNTKRTYPALSNSVKNL